MKKIYLYVFIVVGILLIVWFFWLANEPRAKAGGDVGGIIQYDKPLAKPLADAEKIKIAGLLNNYNDKTLTYADFQELIAAWNKYNALQNWKLENVNDNLTDKLNEKLNLLIQ